MNFKTYEYCIGVHYVCAIEYGDESELSDEESIQLAEFIEALPVGAGHWSWGDHEEFSECDISGLRGDCSRAEYLVAQK